MAAGKKFAVSITINAVDKASKSLAKVARNLRGMVKGIARPFQFITDTFANLGSVLGQLLSPIVKVGRALWNFATTIISTVIRKLMSMLKWILLVGAAIVTEFSRRAINAFADYEQAITNAATVTGLMGDALESAKKRLFEFGLALSRISAKTPTDIGGAFYALSSAGLSVTETMAAAPKVLALAEGTLADMGLTAELSTSSMRAFSFQAEDMNRIVNVLAASIGVSRLNMERLSLSLPYAATSAAQLHVSLEQTVAALAMIVNRGVQATTAGTQLRMMFAKLMDVTKKGRAVLRRYGLVTADVNIQQRGLLAVLRTLQKANISFTHMQRLLGIRAATAGIILMKNAEQFENLRKKITGTNRASEMQQQQLKTLQGRWAILKSTLQEVQIRFAQALSPVVQEVNEHLQKFVERVLAMGIAEKAAGWLGDMATKVMEFIENMILTGKLQAMWDKLVGGVMKLYVFVKTLLPKVAQIGASAFKALGEWLIYAADWVKYLVATVRKEFPAIAATVIPIITGIAKAFVWMLAIGDAVIRFFQILTNVVGIVLTGAMFVLLGIVNALTAAVGALIWAMSQIPGLGGILGPAAASIDNAVKSMENLRLSFGDEFIRRSADLAKNMRDLGAAGGKFAPQFEAIKGMEARGQQWAGQMDTSGVIVPPRPIAPGQAGGPTVNINIPGGMIAPEDLPDTIAEAVNDAMRQAGYAGT